MADDFDPYYKWFGIPPQEQPPNYYRLLSVTPGESDPEVLSAAADRQMAFLKTVRGGQHMDVAERLLNEVADARRTLLNTERRREYDRQLAALAAKRSASPAPSIWPVQSTAAVSTAAVPVRQPKVKPSDPVNGPLAANASRIPFIVSTAGVFVTAVLSVVAVWMLFLRGSGDAPADGSRDSSRDPSARRTPVDASRSQFTNSSAPGEFSSAPVSLLSLIHPERDTIGRPATLAWDGLSKAEKSSVVLPVVVADRYELRVTFTPGEANPAVALTLPVGDHMFSFWAGSLSGLSCVDGYHVRLQSNPTRRTGTQFVPGRRYELAIQVAVDGDMADIQSTLDGDRFINERILLSRLGRWSTLEQTAFRQPTLQHAHTAVCNEIVYQPLAPGTRYLEPGEAWAARPWTSVGIVGHEEGAFVHQQANAGGKLIGFQAHGDEKITAVRPVFQYGDQPALGQPLLAKTIDEDTSIAKSGYAVGGLIARFDGRLRGMQLIFMRDLGDRLDPSDQYRGAWIGSDTGTLQRPVLSDGRLITGFSACVVQNSLICLGLTSTQQDWMPSDQQPILPQGQWVDLLKIIAPETDSVVGTWKRNGERLQLTPISQARLAVPLEFRDASYDVRLEFERQTGNEGMHVELPIHQHSVLLEVDSQPRSGYSTFLSMAERLRADEHPNALHGQLIQNGLNQYEISVQTEDAIAHVTFRLNGRQVFDYQTQAHCLEPVQSWRLWHGRQLGLAANDAGLVVSHFALRLNAGQARLVPLVIDR